MAYRNLNSFCISIHRTGCNLTKRYLFFSVFREHSIRLKDKRFPAAAKHFCRNHRHTFSQFRAGFFHCFSRYIGCAGSIGSRIIGRAVGIGSVHHDIINAAFQTFRGNLGKRGITPGSHIRGTDGQGIESVIIQLNRCRSHIHAGDTGTLHGHGHSFGTDFSIPHILRRWFCIPVKHFFCPCHTTVQSAGIHLFVVIRRSNLSLTHHIFFPDHCRIHLQPVSQFIHCTLKRKDSLRCTISAIGTCRLHIRIHHIVMKTKCFQISIVKRDRFMSGKAHCRWSMFSISTGIGKCIEINGTDRTILHSPKANPNLHFMARRACRLTLLSAENKLGRLSGLPGDKGREYLRYTALFCPKATAHAWLGYSNPGHLSNTDFTACCEPPARELHSKCGSPHLFEVFLR